MIFNVDFEKAYDSVRWDYLDDILKKFGFGDKWCGWIRNCLISSKGSVIVNGSPTKEFQFHRGLKQGDPLFSFLFILIMQSLHISMQRVMDAVQRVMDEGLHINMTKSKPMRISVSSDKVDQTAKKIGCAVLKVPFPYLGSNVGCLMSRTQSWNEIVNNILARLSKWNMKTLSIGGRLTLLKSVLEHNGKKHIWVKWNKVLASKEKGGLGVSSLYALNRALLFKWVWRFHTQQSSLWTKVIKEIHGVDGKLGKHVKNHHPSIWMDIVREEDAWRGDNNFKSLYLRMHALETQKNVTVASKMSHVDMSSSFRRAPRGGSEESQFTQLFRNMEGFSLVGMKDRWIWSSEGCMEFAVASIRKVLDDRSLPVVSSKTRWIHVVPIKVNIHAWKVRLDSLPTRLNISKRDMDIESILCPICNKEVESSSHVFFTCHIAREIF
ncbi:RNA-directed DNA polymerase, eukaryota, reverse transcriptase zinc-binding domain protein, partial [Tanacetum coccineum]